jgi:5-methylcytosine-specific restriction endonuclease McrA
VVNSTCSIDGCEKPAGTRGWCGMHYARYKRNGDPLALRRPAVRLCPVCNAVEMPRGHDAPAYCRDCTNARRRDARAREFKANPVMCAECGGPLPYRWAGKRYCSDGCAATGERVRNGYLTSRETRACAYRGCNATFEMTRKYHKYCSRACGLDAAHERRMSDPDWLKTHAEGNRRWLAENPWYHAVRNGRRRARLRDVTSIKFTSGDLESRFVANAGKCWICGSSADTWDHVKPILAGGPHMLANLRPACRPCNSSKGGRWSGVKLLRTA